MRSIRRILVGVKDPGKKPSAAVTKAAQLASALGASLELFHALATPLYFDGYTSINGELNDIERSMRANSLAQLERIAMRLRPQGIDVTVCAVWDFPSYEAVVRRAEQIKADLIVAEQHDGRHIAAGLLHLVDWELLRLSPIPVLLVKKEGRYRSPKVLAAIDPVHARSKPAGLDNEILGTASIVASALRGTLHAVHAYIATPSAIVPTDSAGAEALPKLLAQTALKARASLDGALHSTTIPKSRRHVVGRHPVDAIEQTARKIHSSIVVMGAVSRSGLKRLFIGNTAERVLDQLTCDVLIVKPSRFEARVPRALRGVRLVAMASTTFPF
jgi:universal stress protein E